MRTVGYAYLFFIYSFLKFIFHFIRLFFITVGLLIHERLHPFPQPLFDLRQCAALCHIIGRGGGGRGEGGGGGGGGRRGGGLRGGLGSAANTARFAFYGDVAEDTRGPTCFVRAYDLHVPIALHRRCRLGIELNLLVRGRAGTF